MSMLCDISRLVCVTCERKRQKYVARAVDDHDVSRPAI